MAEGGLVSDAPRSPATTRYPVAGTDIAEVTFDQVLVLCLGAVARQGRLSVHFCTTHTLVEAADDPVLRARLEKPDAVACPDGMPLVWVGRAAGRHVDRVCGPDFMPALFDRGREIGARHALYGGAPGVADELSARLKERFPGAEVVLAESPPFRALTPEEDAAEVAKLNAARPDFIWVGLGSPKQDHWVATHRERLEAPVLFAVGAAFDFHAGRVRRAPRIMQRTGTEWLFRLLSEPRRLLRRYTVTNSRFLALLISTRRIRRRPAA